MVFASDEFVPFDPELPLDPEPFRRRVPKDHEVRGMQFNAVLDAIRAVAPPTAARWEEERRYQGFEVYPMEEYIELALVAAEAMHPERSLRAGLFEVGKVAQRGVGTSVAGRTLITLAGQEYLRAMPRLPEAYAMAISPGTVEVVTVTNGRFEVAFRNVWTFPEAYHLGVLEAALAHFDLRGRPSFRRLSPCDVDIRFDDIAPR